MTTETNNVLRGIVKELSAMRETHQQSLAVNLQMLAVMERVRPEPGQLAHALELIDGAFEVVELFYAKSPSQIEWKKAWLEKARKLILSTIDSATPRPVHGHGGTGRPGDRTPEEEAAFYESGLSAHGCLEKLDGYARESITRYGRLLAEAETAKLRDIAERAIENCECEPTCSSYYGDRCNCGRLKRNGQLRAELDDLKSQRMETTDKHELLAGAGWDACRAGARAERLRLEALLAVGDPLERHA